MPPAKSSKLSAEVQKKIEAIRKQKKALPKGMEPVPKEQAAISDQISVLSKAGLQTIPMDKLRVYQGDKVIEINKPQFMGNPKTNIWSASGSEIERPASEVPTQDTISSDFMKLMAGMNRMNPAASAEQKAEEDKPVEEAPEEEKKETAEE